jgi:hypothetical protein
MPNLRLQEKQLRQLAQIHYRLQRMKEDMAALSGDTFVAIQSILPDSAKPVVRHLVATLGGADVASSLGITADVASSSRARQKSPM